jgi:hypothetical protein
LRPYRHHRHVVTRPAILSPTRRADVTLVVTCWDVLAVDAHAGSARTAATLSYLAQEGRLFRTILHRMIATCLGLAGETHVLPLTLAGLDFPSALPTPL